MRHYPFGDQELIIRSMKGRYYWSMILGDVVFIPKGKKAQQSFHDRWGAQTKEDALKIALRAEGIRVY